MQQSDKALSSLRASRNDVSNSMKADERRLQTVEFVLDTLET